LRRIEFMPCHRKHPTFDTKGSAIKSGAQTFGHGNYSVRKITEHKWRAYER
jgi:hypothetical protein